MDCVCNENGKDKRVEVLDLTLLSEHDTIIENQKERERIMKIQKEIKDIKFTECDVYGTKMPVSENIVMSSAAGWYVGSVCKDPDCGGMIVPFDRYTDYYATPEDVAKNCAIFL